MVLQGQKQSQAMDRAKADPAIFSQPIRQIVTMMVVTGLVAAGGWLIHAQVVDILRTNLFLNGLIAGVFLLGVATCFWQVLILMQSVSWIEEFARGRAVSDMPSPPRLLMPLAALLRARGARSAISTSSARSIQESVESRIEESRDITRYLINLLVFLGLLGTFYGLAISVPAIVETIRGLAPQEGEAGVAVFGRLMGGLESQLGGMGTAFSSSLLGLAGSLVVGLLELFAGHGQNRFVRELEEWLSSITRIGYTAEEGEPAGSGQLGAVLEGLSNQVEALQMIAQDADAGLIMMQERLEALSAAVTALATRDTGAAQLSRIAEGQERMAAALAEADTGAAQLARIAEGQERLIAALTSETGGGPDAESRMRLRSIDVQLLRILEEISAGRQESVADLRAELTALTAAVRALSRGRV